MSKEQGLWIFAGRDCSIEFDPTRCRFPDNRQNSGRKVAAILHNPKLLVLVYPLNVSNHAICRDCGGISRRRAERDGQPGAADLPAAVRAPCRATTRAT